MAARKVNNFARFYAAFNQLPYAGDREEFKKSIVRQYTWDRTDSLREMDWDEYKSCCEALEKLTGKAEALRKKRSICLKLMQELGIDTTDWTRINAFCQDARIAGKPFAWINVDGLDALAAKLRAIRRSGGLRQGKDKKSTGGKVYMMVDPDAKVN